MPGRKSSSKIQNARRWLAGGRILRDDSDDELGYDDLPWEWIYGSDLENAKDQKTMLGKKRKRGENSLDADKDEKQKIVGAKMGSFTCQVGDAVMLKAADNQAWVGLICEFREDEESGEKEAYFMWFSSPDEIRNKAKKKTDFLPVRDATWHVRHR
jgi:origin recognition complex subunit 1